MSVASLSADPSRYDPQNYKCGDHKQHTFEFFQEKFGDDWHDNSHRDMVLEAVQICPFAIRYAESHHKDLSIAKKAIEMDGLARFWFSEVIKENPELAATAEKNLLKSRQGRPSVNPRFFITTQVDERFNILSLFNASEGLISKPQLFSLKNTLSSMFIRDSAITLPDGSHLLPYPIKNTEGKIFDEKFIAMLPSTASHFLLSSTEMPIPRTLFGRGFRLQNIDQARFLAYEYDLSYISGQTTIEGGNCFIFLSNGIRKAIVGEFSLYLSMLALEEQNAFEDIQPIEPSEESYRMARNLDLHEGIKSETPEPDVYQSILKLIAYRKQLLAPVTPEERVKYHAEAAIFEAKLQATRVKIAKELRCPIENVIFLPQIYFHIDMSMTVTPDGTVMLYDPKTTQMFLHELIVGNDFSKAERLLWKDYITQVDEDIKTCQKTVDSIKELLRSSNIDFVLMPSVLSYDFCNSALNYCNGLFVERSMNETPAQILSSDAPKRKYNFYTTGPTEDFEKIFHEKFAALFHATFPNYNLVGIPSMSHFIAKMQGGFHCLTTEG